MGRKEIKEQGDIKLIYLLGSRWRRSKKQKSHVRDRKRKERDLQRREPLPGL